MFAVSFRVNHIIILECVCKFLFSLISVVVQVRDITPRYDYMLSFVNIFFYVVVSFGRRKSVHVNTIERKNVLAM